MFRIVFIFLLSFAFGQLAIQSKTAIATEIGITPETPIGDVFSGIEGVIKQLEESASKLIQEGNVLFGH